MIRIALVEDDAACRQMLMDYLARYEEECAEVFRISQFTDGTEIVNDYKANYDIILLDIDMRFMDGMTAAERIRKQDMEVVIIFVTNMPQYVMQGYTVGAMDYVLKPITYYAFSQRIDRAIQRMKRRRKRYIAVTNQSGMIKLDVSQITYIEVRDHELVYHTKKDTISTKGTLSDAHQMLNDRTFFRCNKSFLINLEYVEAVRNYDVQIGDMWLPVSRTKKKALLDALNDYINEVSK